MRGNNPFSDDNPFSDMDGMAGLEDLMGTIFGGGKVGEGGDDNPAESLKSLLDELKQSEDKKMLREIGAINEVGELMNPAIEIDMDAAYDKLVVELSRTKLHEAAVVERVNKLMLAVDKQSRVIVAEFKEQEKRHDECHVAEENRRKELYAQIDDQYFPRTFYTDAVNSIDRRIGGYIADLKGSKGNFKKADVIAFLESLRDRAQDARDQESYREDAKSDPAIEFPKSRAIIRQEEAAAVAEAAEANKKPQSKTKAKAAGAAG